MSAAPIPKDEEQRLAVLRACAILDSEPEAAFDDVVELARHVCATPIALVSLVDRDRQWFKARVGFAEPQTSRDISFCAHALATDAPLVVEDAVADARFVDNPFVTEPPHVRFYAGAPIRVDGQTVGTVCVLDTTPRQLTPKQLSALDALARQVAREIVLRRADADTRDRGPRRPTSGAEGLATDDLVQGRYRIRRLLGAGGMGEVYAADDEQRGAHVALKVLRPVFAGKHEVERFVREGRALRAIEHENVARILDAGNLDDGSPFLVLERLDETIADAARGKRLDEIVGLVQQACAGVAAVHAAGIVHRDVKPGNLLVTRRPDGSFVVKVVDFGIAKLAARHLGDEGAVTREGDVVGSPHYMAPEQMLASRDVGPAADVWSLGVVLYELLGGALPFTGNMMEVCSQVLLSAPPRVSALRREVPEGLDAIVQRCLTRDPAQRLATAAELVTALEPYRAR